MVDSRVVGLDKHHGEYQSLANAAAASTRPRVAGLDGNRGTHGRIVTDSVDRAGVFSLACAALRLVLLVLWLYRTTRSGRSVGRTITYNGATAAIWVAAAFVPSPFNFALWAVAILIEAALLRTGRTSSSRSILVDTAHASERLSLFMIILMGESVLSLVTSLGEHWTVASGVAAFLGFIAICSLAAGFFVFGVNTMELGLARLSGKHDFNGLLDTVMFLPYLLVIGVTMFAAGLSTVVAAPSSALPTGAAISLSGGVALFYLTNTIISIRWGTPLKRLLRWAIPGVPLPLLVPFLAPHVPAIVALCVIAGIVLVIIGGSAVSRVRRLG